MPEVAVRTPPSVGELIRLLADHREALLQRGPGAADEIEARSRGLEEALAALAAGSGGPGGSAASSGMAASSGSSDSGAAGGMPPFGPRPSPAELARLQDELQATQATLSRLAAGNRRALDTLFGEASLYSR